MNKNMHNLKGLSFYSPIYWIRLLTYTLTVMGMIIILGFFEFKCDNDHAPGVDVVWEYVFLTSDDEKSSPAIANDGTIYVGSSDKNVYAINSDGSLKWLFNTDGKIESSPAIGSDGTIYVGSLDNNLYAINFDGLEKWRYTTGSFIKSSPTIGSDGTIYVGSADYNLYAINPDGSEKWLNPAPTGGYINSSPAIGCNGILYVGSLDDNLYAINPDGSQKWFYATGGDIASSPAIGSDGTLYVGSRDHYLYAINPDGSRKWRYRTDDEVESSPAIGSDGTIYVGSDDQNVYAINPDGSLKWRYPFAYGPISSSPAIGDDGTIYLGSADFFAINPDGTKKQQYDLPWTLSSPAVGSDGILYLTTEGKLLALDVASDRLADTPWPMFKHDLKHTGRLSNAEIPTLVNATAGDSQVVISWNPGPGGLFSNIYWSTSPGVTKSDSKISEVYNPYSHTGLTNGTTYYYAVTTENFCGESAISNEVSATPAIAGTLSVTISPGDGPTGNICPDTTIYTANVTGGTSPYFYSWGVTTTDGAGFNIISLVDQQTFEVCPWDSMTRGTIEVTVTDSNSQITLDNINVSAF